MFRKIRQMSLDPFSELVMMTTPYPFSALNMASDLCPFVSPPMEKILRFPSAVTKRNHEQQVHGRLNWLHSSLVKVSIPLIPYLKIQIVLVLLWPPH